MAITGWPTPSSESLELYPRDGYATGSGSPNAGSASRAATSLERDVQHLLDGNADVATCGRDGKHLVDDVVAPPAADVRPEGLPPAVREVLGWSSVSIEPVLLLSSPWITLVCSR